MTASAAASTRDRPTAPARATPTTPRATAATAGATRVTATAATAATAAVTSSRHTRAMRTPAVRVAWRVIALGWRTVAIDFTYRRFGFRAVGSAVPVDLAVVARIPLPAVVAMPILFRRVVASLAERHSHRL